MNTYKYVRLALAVMFFFLTAGLSSAQPWYTVTWVKIGLEFDKDRHDRYGRLLAYIFLADHSFVNSQKEFWSYE
jgi:hypothetical protein